MKSGSVGNSFCSPWCDEPGCVEISRVGPVCMFACLRAIPLASPVEQDLSGRPSVTASEGQRLKMDELKAET